MKKVLVIFLTTVLAVSFVACGNKNDVTSSETVSKESISKESSQEIISSDEASSKEEIREFRVQGSTHFYAPIEWKVFKNSNSSVVCKSEDTMVSISYRYQTDPNNDLEKIIEKITYTAFSDAAGRCHGNIRNSSINVISTEKSTLADIECLKFTGLIPNSSVANSLGDWDCHAYGYTFIYDGAEFMICGIVSKPEQDPELIAEINELTDFIAESIHEK